MPLVNGLPTVLAQHLARIGVEQQLGRVEALPLRRCPGAVHAVAIDQAGLGTGQQAMPQAVAVAELEAGSLVRAAVVEQAQLHGLRVGRGQAKVDAVGLQAGAQAAAVSGEQGRGHQTLARVRIRIRVDSGGSVRRSDWGWWWAGNSSVCVRPLATPLPP